MRKYKDCRTTTTLSESVPYHAGELTPDALPDSALYPSEELQAKTSQITPENSLERTDVLFVEPFYGGSHKQLIDTLMKWNVGAPNSHLVSLTAKKWHWRARCSSLIVSSTIPELTSESALFCSSVLSLAELLGLRPDLQALKKIVYFHENQLVYPIREIKERDMQFAYNQITTCLAADVVVFNSHYNMSSFLDNIKNIIRMLPDNKPKNLKAKIEPKCCVLYFPVEFSKITIARSERANSKLHIAWPHRWEFDKDPHTFVKVLGRLKSDNLPFKVSFLGETFTDIPDIFTQAKELLKEEIVNFGFITDKGDYFEALQLCHVAVSTAKHEFFGVSMLEASYCGCFPLVPDRLVYPEIYPDGCVYCSEDDLYLRLKQYCLVPSLATEHREALNFDFNKFNVENLIPKYLQLFA